MPMMIVDDCVSCAACETECPNDAISSGDTVFIVDQARCTECVGAYDKPQCVEACPIAGCIVQDPAHPESVEELAAKYARLH